jgi:tetratricopeptide (TPR) repeat protein
VALDDKSGDDDGAMAMHWIKAAKQNDIPVAFVINKEGRVVWIGQPNSLTETFLEKVLADRLDMAQAIAEFEQNEKKKAQLSQLPGKIIKGIRNRNWNDAETALAELEKLAPERQGAVGTFRFQILLGRKDYAAAYKLAGSLSDSNQSDSSLQSDLARTIVCQKGLDERDVALAEKIAARANNAANGKDPSYLDTLARAQFMNGKKKEAVETEQKALELAPDFAKTLFENRLKSYEDGQLPAVDE